ncbi:hypothetical protein [uncultured Alistipes sp.]|uniref:hypothetical protein n=1 Tax=uncultured Alistipes sp. TaxID=538949 RepID=UPI0025A52861|nr:hypothetical protein [uncultured Alistipes sp.]
MRNDLVSINGKLLSTMGVTLLAGAYSALMTPAPLKDFVENEDPLKDGTDVLSPSNGGSLFPRIKERDVTLTFLIQGENEAEFKRNYAAFVKELVRRRSEQILLPYLLQLHAVRQLQAQCVQTGREVPGTQPARGNHRQSIPG